jgi:hypothetical protein
MICLAIRSIASAVLHMGYAKLRSALLLYLTAMVLLHAAILWRSRELLARGYGDFASFYTAGKILRSGQREHLYDRSLQWQVQQQFASTVDIRKGPLPYIRPPFHALLFLPLAYLSYASAFRLWLVINLALVTLIAYVLRPVLPRTMADDFKVTDGILTSLGFFPVAFDLLQGQDAILLLLIVALAFCALQRGADKTSGFLLALGLFKFHLIFPLAAVFLLRKKLALVSSFAATATGLFLVSVCVVGWKVLISYPTYLWQLSQAPALAGMKPRSMPNIRGLASLSTAPANLGHMNWIFALVAIIGIILAAILWRVDNTPTNQAVGFSFAIVVDLLVSYYSNSYDLSLLLIPILLLGRAALDRRQTWSLNTMLFAGTVALLLFSPLYWLLAVRSEQFAWAGLLLFPLAISLAMMLKTDYQYGLSE